MAADETAHVLDSEKRQRRSKSKEVLRLLNPDLTDAELEELTVQLWQELGSTHG